MNCPLNSVLAHNTERSGPNRDVPVIIEHPEHFQFGPGEREQYHEASDEEYAAYCAYWNAKHDAEVEPDEDDLAWARDDMGPGFTPDEVYEVADRRARERARE